MNNDHLAARVSKDEQAAHILSSGECTLSLVHLVKPVLACNQCVQLELAAEVQIDQSAEVVESPR